MGEHDITLGELVEQCRRIAIEVAEHGNRVNALTEIRLCRPAMLTEHLLTKKAEPFGHLPERLFGVPIYRDETLQPGVIRLVFAKGHTMELRIS